VEIFHNNLMGGTVLCTTANNFEVQTDLFQGQNTIVVRSFNETDDEGPVSAPVTVFYDLPQPPSGGKNINPNTSKPKANANPLVLKTAFVYKGYYVGQIVKWPVEVSGGSPPYALNVDWGDGSNDVISRGSADQFDLTHKYSRTGGYKGSYEIKVKAADSAGQKAFLQFFVIVNAKETASASGGIFTKSPPSLGGKSWLWVAWPAYGLVLLMAVSYLLGEKEELLLLRKKGLLKR
jgi:hypothetical protein